MAAPAMRKNLFGFGSSQSPAKPRRSSLSLGEAARAAYKAGYATPDTGHFRQWLQSKGLGDRSDPVISRLQSEYDRGFEKKMADERARQETARRREADDANRKFLARMAAQHKQEERQAEATRRAAAKVIRYKGREITAAGDGFRVRPGDGSIFDSVRDAQRFVDDEVKHGRNPKKGGAKAAARDALATYDSVTGAVGKYTVGLPRTLLGKSLGVNPMKKKAKKNCCGKSRRNPPEGAAEMYESFHGKPSEGTLTVEESIHEHENLATLGVLISLTVATISGLEAVIGMTDKDARQLDFDETVADPDTMYLSTNEDGTQLYIVGGDQSLDLDALKLADMERDDMVIGSLVELTYRTRKKFDKFQLTDYFHELGEETGELPLLRYEPRSPHLYITGGNYKIKKPLIGVSPGIEN